VCEILREIINLQGELSLKTRVNEQFGI